MHPLPRASDSGHGLFRGNPRPGQQLDRAAQPGAPLAGRRVWWPVGSWVAGLEAVSAASLPPCPPFRSQTCLRPHSCSASALPPPWPRASSQPARLPPAGPAPSHRAAASSQSQTGQSRLPGPCLDGQGAWASVYPPLVGGKRVGLELRASAEGRPGRGGAAWSRSPQAPQPPPCPACRSGGGGGPTAPPGPLGSPFYCLHRWAIPRRLGQPPAEDQRAAERTSE